MVKNLGVTLFYMDGSIATEGLQSALFCDEALQAARRIAKEKGCSVLVMDAPAFKSYRVTPAGHIWRVPKDWPILKTKGK